MKSGVVFFEIHSILITTWVKIELNAINPEGGHVKIILMSILVATMLGSCGLHDYYYEKPLKAGKHTIVVKLKAGKYLLRVSWKEYPQGSVKKLLFRLKSSIRVGNDVIGALTPDSVQLEQDVEDTIFSKWISVQKDDDTISAELEIMPTSNSGIEEFKFIIEQPKP